MERMALTAEERVEGKGAASRMRRGGRVPAVLYGRALKPASISIDRRELERAVKTKAGMNVLVDLSVEGGYSGLARIRDFQADPFRRDFTHVDFQAISLTEQLAVEVPVVLTGQAAGVKEGGVVEQLRRTISILALPEKIPEKIEIDITDLKIGDSIHADEIRLPGGIAFPHAVNFTIVAIVPPAKEEVAAPVIGAAEVPAEGAVPAEGEAAAAAAAETKAGEEKKEAKKESKG